MSAEGRLLDCGGYNRPVPWRGSTVSCLQPMDMMAVYQEGDYESLYRSYVFDNQIMTRQKANLEPINGLPGKFVPNFNPQYKLVVAILEVEIKAPPVVLQATTHFATSGSNHRKRTRSNTQAELVVTEGSSLNTVCRCDSADIKRRRCTTRHTNGEGSSSAPSGIGKHNWVNSCKAIDSEINSTHTLPNGPYRVIDENDERLKGFKKKYGEDVHRVVAVPMEHTSPQSYGTSQRAEKILYKDLLAF
ncbi:hypothetical protein Tco_0385838 [Tanacetum coccineum]